MELVPAYDLETVKNRYIDVIDHTPGIERHARRQYGRHPTEQGLRSYIGNGEMYLLMLQGAFAGMAAVVICQGREYEAVSWAEKLENLRSRPFICWLSVRNTGEDPWAARSLTWRVNWQSSTERKRCASMCRDRIFPRSECMKKPDLFAGKKQRWYAENTGWTDFLLYEKKLT